MRLPRAIILLLVFVTMLAVTNPVAADQPGTNEDPFGGHPITGALGPEAGEGIVAKFGLSPFGYAWPGGVPSNKSGDGTTPRRAINIGGIWGGRGDIPLELSNCATLKIPAGAGRWFKLDTWSDRRVRIWLDDELDGATKPSGSSVWGAADQYMLGTAPDSAWQKNALSGSQSANFLEGFVMAIYDPDNLKPMWFFSPPNAAILSVNTDSAGLLQRSRQHLCQRCNWRRCACLLQSQPKPAKPSPVVRMALRRLGVCLGLQPNDLGWHCQCLQPESLLTSRKSQASGLSLRSQGQVSDAKFQVTRRPAISRGAFCFRVSLRPVTIRLRSGQACDLRLVTCDLQLAT